ncbi:MAG: glutamine synthetase family protein [Pseudomonadota bacterium]
MAGKLDLNTLRKAVEEGEIDTVVAALPDMQGRLMGKRFQAEFFLDSAHAETHGCNYLLATDIEMETVPGYAATSWEKGYGDYTLRPDLSTLRRTPWLEGTALVLCDVFDHHGHDEIAHAPRTVLKHQIARLADRGLSALAASELEFFVFADSFEQAAEKGLRGLQTMSGYNEDYHIFQTTKEEELMRAIRTGLQGAGIPVENSKGEAEAGQEEINIRHADALTMADRHTILKNAVKEIAWSQERAVTFMAKWSYAHAGSSSHIHMSLADRGGQPAFHDPGATHGMSDTMRAFLAGILANADAITLLLAPYINSYKRFAEGTFAPTKAVWSRDNRTAGYRICGENSRNVRLECRIGGADLNPYLAYAGLIAAGLDGLERGLALEPEFRGDAYVETGREIPKTLRAASEAFSGSAMLAEAFGAEVVEHYAHAAQWEQFECDRRVTDWELARGFERA